MTVADNATGYREIPPEDRKKAQAFFDRGRTVADTGNYDYGIEMFLHGLELDPDSVEAHKELRDISLRRRASGKKALGMFEVMKLKRSKDEKQAMLNAEKLLAYDPGNTDHMLSLVQNAYRNGYYDTVLWIGPILHRANADAPSGKPDFNKFIALKDVYRAIATEGGLPHALRARIWTMATEAAYAAALIRPEDMELQSEMKNLAANQTMSQGNYEGGGSFRDSIRDADRQRDLLDRDKGIASEDYVARTIRDAQAQYEADPDEAGKINRLVEALLKAEKKEQEDRALEILDKAYKRSNSFRFRQRYGQIRLRQLVREQRDIDRSLRANPDDESIQQQRRLFIQYRLEEELNEYRLWSENYPTDLSLKSEIAKRLFMLGQFEEAIPMLQQARQDPKGRTEATIYLGRAFYEAGFTDEAIDTLKVMIDEYQLRGDNLSKEMYYWYGRALEKKGDNDASIKALSQVAQWDFNYRDVQTRIKRLRNPGQ